MQPPDYFNNIQRRASERWDQLERDPDLAGPWHQLFRQVQSPRHVVSELLQNADDAGAKSASVRVEDNVFIFEHDGGDFDEEQLTSLCRFGFSNKRQLAHDWFQGCWIQIHVQSWRHRGGAHADAGRVLQETTLHAASVVQ